MFAPGEWVRVPLQSMNLIKQNKFQPKSYESKFGGSSRRGE